MKARDFFMLFIIALTSTIIGNLIVAAIVAKQAQAELDSNPLASLLKKF